MSATLQSHTPNHKNCPACAELQVMNTSLSLELPFSTASEIWIFNHRTYIKPKTYTSYCQYLKKLNEFFGDLPLQDFHIGNIRAYQRWRGERAGATRINMELSALQMMLKEVNHWRHVEGVYRPLPVPKTKVRQNMSEEEERRLVAVALDSSKPRRLLAGHCLILMANTSMGFGELRHLRREDIFLSEDRPYITINGGTKNDYRIRTVPLNFLALRSMRFIIRRWEDLGGTEPAQYILPHHARRTDEEKACKGHKRKSPPIWTEPMGHIYRAARGILQEAGLGHLDPYDMRSHACTKLLSDPDVSDQVYEEITGHKGQAMRRRYSKQRLEKKGMALDRMASAIVDGAPLILFPGGRRA